MRLSIDDSALFETVFAVLKRGAVVVMPCDTIYGLVGVAPDTGPLLRRLKGREERSFLQLIASPDWLPAFTDQRLPESLSKYWPGPLTIIFRAKAPPNAPAGAPASGPDPRAGKPSPPATVALRIPRDPLLLEIMEKLGRPLFSTSVNLTGQPSLWRIQEIFALFEERVDLIVDAGDRPGGVPSTILDITSRPFRILRPGAVEVPDVLML
jgi:L-threonylcarbamoyladenylate synthase